MHACYQKFTEYHLILLENIRTVATVAIYFGFSIFLSFYRTIRKVVKLKENSFIIVLLMS